MNDLSSHLVEANSHAYLPFHHACPACRAERLAGALHQPPLVSPRARAGLAAVVVATSALAPVAGLGAPAAMAEEDQEQGGAAEPGMGPPGDVHGTDPGSHSDADTPLGEQQSAAGVGAGDDDSDGDEGGPVEDVVPDQDDDPPGDVGALKRETAPAPGPDTRSGADSQTDGAKEMGAADGSGQRSSDTDAKAEDEPGEAAGPAADKEKGARDQSPQTRQTPTADQPSRPRVSGPAINSSAVPESQAPITPETSARSTSSTSPPSSMARVSRSERDSGVHVVRPGESLWSIATALRGRDATSAEVAREVSRLWSLNAASIATGDPDLLMVGQRLRLR